MGTEGKGQSRRVKLRRIKSLGSENWLSQLWGPLGVLWAQCVW